MCVCHIYTHSGNLGNDTKNKTRFFCRLRVRSITWPLAHLSFCIVNICLLAAHNSQVRFTSNECLNTFYTDSRMNHSRDKSQIQNRDRSRLLIVSYSFTLSNSIENHLTIAHRIRYARWYIHISNMSIIYRLNCPYYYSKY